MLVRGYHYLLWGGAGRIYDFSKNHTFFHCFEDCERRRGSVAPGFWEACGSNVGRMTLRELGLMSNINGDRVWFYRAHFGIDARLLWGEAAGKVIFFLDVVVPGWVLASYLMVVEYEWFVGP